MISTSASQGVSLGGGGSLSGKTVIPEYINVGYNGRRGDGTLQSQGWSQISGGAFTPTEQSDSHGGYYLHITKNNGVVWDIRQPASESPGDLIRYGGRLFCRFRLTGSVSEGRYAFAFYLKVSPAEIPSGVTLANDGSASMSPTVMNFAVSTKGGKIVLCQHRGSKSGNVVEIADWGTFDNEWHTMELIYPGSNDVMITPVLDGEAKAPVSLSYSGALVPDNTIYVTSITGGTVYVTDIASFEGQIYRDSGGYVLSPRDAGNQYYFPPGYHRGVITLPDEKFPQGFSVSIVANGAKVTLHPATDDVLLQPPGASEGYPVDALLSSTVTLIQTGLDGKTWTVV
ncbi:hypothetical protein LA938_000363 [Salmonella enterica subsp. enterica serovar Mikawasima]|nr:hypothetical protein [Salmonella enterica subsp. enterica serovar Mikawasima]EID1816874.1 hypothetical protein [Salmonella enterica subsp. enterica serovar Mikawasima]